MSDQTSQRVEHPVHAPSAEPSSLWHAAYEHPGYVAAGAAAVALGIGAIVATHGYAAKLSPFAARNVLLVEDGPFGAAMEATLKEHHSILSWLTGPNVTRVSGIKSLEPFTAITPQGADVVLNPSKFNVALVNGLSMTKVVPGPEVAAELARHNVTTIATSLTKGLNDEMVAKGAAFAVPKSTVLPALMEGQLDLRSAVLAPNSVKEDVLGVTERMANRSDPLRQAADARLMEFVQKEAARS